MGTILCIIQDYITLNVLEVQEVDKSYIEKIKFNAIFSLNKNGIDKYILKEKYYNKNHTQILIKVKINKLSKQFSLFTHFQIENKNPYSYLRQLERKIEKIINQEKKHTHIHSLVKKGKPQIAKKFGEEAVELVIEAGKNDDEKFTDEAADVFYYFLILLYERGIKLVDILEQLKTQKRKN